MNKRLIVLLAGTLAVGLAGCTPDKPHKYGKERPPIDEIDEGGRGLQSKDLLQATDQMTMDLLALPELNRSDRKWTIVAQAMENQTITQRQNLDIFVDRLKTQLFKQGGGRIALIENRDRYRDFQSRELEQAGATDTPPAGPGVQPQYVLYGKMQELQAHVKSTYRAEFNLTNLKTREQVWTGEYIVKVNE